MFLFVMPPNFDILFLDWSGCVSNDLEAVYTTQIRLVQKFGKPALELNSWRRVFTSFTALYAASGIDVNKLPAELFPETFELVYEAGIKPTIYPDAKEALEKISRKVPIIIVSAHMQYAIEREAEQYGIAKCISKIYGGVGDKSELLLREKGTKKTIFVEDMVQGIRAGKKAGMQTVAVTRGYHFPDMLLAENADYYINDLTGLEKILL